MSWVDEANPAYVYIARIKAEELVMAILSFVGGPLHLQNQTHLTAPDRIVVPVPDGSEFTYRRKMTLTEGPDEIAIQVFYAPAGMSEAEFHEGVKQLPMPDDLDE